MLSELAMRSKAYWGYDNTFMEGCRKELTLTDSEISDSLTYVLEGGTGMLGFYRLKVTGSIGELMDLFLEPSVIKKGYGRMMWEHIVISAQNAALTSIRLDADPHAEGFYKKMGCRTVGLTLSQSFPGRTLPLMVCDIPTN